MPFKPNQIMKTTVIPIPHSAEASSRNRLIKVPVALELLEQDTAVVRQAFEALKALVVQTEFDFASRCVWFTLASPNFDELNQGETVRRYSLQAKAESHQVAKGVWENRVTEISLIPTDKVDPL